MAVREVVVYIHGVSRAETDQAHGATYAAFHEAVRDQVGAWPEDFCAVEWGANPAGVADPSAQQLLTTAQRELGKPLLEQIGRTSDWGLHVAMLFRKAIRELVFYGFGDVFYYVSEDGKKAVRAAVAQQIIGHLDGMVGAAGDRLSLTLVAHSAGALVAFDFLFYLFNRAGKGAEGFSADMTRLAAQARRRALRVRRLVTMGSPVTNLAFRSNAVVEKIAAGERLDPKDYGLRADFEAPDALDRRAPRWINFWDKDDAIAWPAQPLMADSAEEPAVEDVYVDIADSPVDAHEGYWTSTKVARALAQRW